MRDFNQSYAQFLESDVRCSVLVARITYRNDAGVLYIPSQDVTGLPASTYAHNARIAENGVSAHSQRIDISTGASSIGSGSLKLVDYQGSLSEAFKLFETDETAIRHASVTVFSGSSDAVWGNLEPLWTQIVSDVTYSSGGITLKLRSPLRLARETIMTPETGRITELDGDGVPTRFNFGCNTASYQDTDLTVGGWLYPADSRVFAGVYRKILKIGDELIAFGSASQIFNVGLGTNDVDAYNSWNYQLDDAERGWQGSPQEDHEVGQAECVDATDWEEVPYLDARPGDLISYLLTGLPLDGSGVALPSHWHAGMARDWLDIQSFTDLQDELPETLRMQKPPGEVTALSWIQEHVLSVLGWQIIETAEGLLTLRKAGYTNRDSDYVQLLQKCDLSSNTSITRRNSQLAHDLTIRYEWRIGTETYGQNEYHLNPWAETRYGASDATREIKIESLIGSGRDEREVIVRLINRHLRWWAQPITVINTSIPGSKHALEVTDAVRVRVLNDGCPSPLRDHSYGNATEVDRTAEIQSWSFDPIRNRINLTLISSGEPITYEPAGSASVDPEDILAACNGPAWPLPNPLTTDETIAPGDYCYDGDLTIVDGVTLTLSAPGTLRLFVSGQLNLDGQIITSGQGSAAGVAGDIGNTQATGGVDGVRVFREVSGGDNVVSDHYCHISLQAPLIQGEFTNLNDVVVTYDAESGAINGIPASLQGSGGGVGGNFRLDNGDPATFFADGARACGEGLNFDDREAGGEGGVGGGGLVTVSAFLSVGINARVALNGSDGQASGFDVAGSGAGGAPGGWLHVSTEPGAVYTIQQNAEAIRGGTDDTSTQLTQQNQTNRTFLRRHSLYNGKDAADLVSDHVRVVYVSAI